MEEQEEPVLKRMKIEPDDVDEDLPQHHWYSVQSYEHPHVPSMSENKTSCETEWTSKASTDHSSSILTGRKQRVSITHSGLRMDEESEDSTGSAQSEETDYKAVPSRGVWVKQEVLTDMPTEWMGQTVQAAPGSSSQHGASVKQEARMDCADSVHACEHCDAAFQQPGRLKVHMRIHTAQRTHTCSECDAAFKHSDSLKKHTLRHATRSHSVKMKKIKMKKNLLVRTGLRSHDCQYCRATFTQSARLQAHMLIHTAQRRYACQHCDAAFSQSSSLKKHMQIHTEEEPCVCLPCGTTFRNSDLLKNHMQIHLNKKPVQHHTVLRRPGTLNTSMLIHARQNPHMCKQCGASFRQSGFLKAHILRHKKQYFYELFNSSSKESIPVDTEHTGQKPYACQHCTATFRRSIGLKAHMLIHTTQRPYKCEHCDAAFRHSMSLERHSQKHANLRTFACLCCDAAFTQSASLKIHMLHHAEQKTFACQHCEATFTQSTSLKAHMLKHTQPRPYSCVYCDASFRRYSRLKKHMIHVHKSQYL